MRHLEPQKEKLSAKRTRMLIAGVILLSFFIVFVGVASLYIQRFEQELADENRVHLSEVASYVSAHVESVVTDTQESLKAVAAAIDILKSPEERMEYLEQVAEQYSFAYIGTARADGLLRANSLPNR